ncbi:MAG: hypothetical protein KAW51_06780 [Candidatus Lokiarchaeota archaeon]|nr:hypothetical protein [Candidatus Lokiarchaeota archaeon]
MVQVFDKEKNPEQGIELIEFIILEELPMEEVQVEELGVAQREKPVKKALLKLINKAKYNSKFLEETVPIEKVRNKIHFRSYAVY